ncbi:DUF4139 domain-containing protein [Fulvimarina sp. MAC8]|uniref:DUF4139 domain-containing protein n=1 Tax=Fulvimarina sp. MAC8 TaxID=3162874 RepID=UPI0032EBCBEE
MNLRTTSMLLAATVIGTAPADAQETRITKIDLGQSGLAKYTLTAEATSDRVTFEVPKADADDVLASLIVQDPAGGVVGLYTDTPSTSSETLRDTPFAGGLPDSTKHLLEALTGEEVTIKTERSEVTGQVMAVTEREEVVDRNVIERPVALILTEDHVAEVVLYPGVSVSFDASDARRLAEAGVAGTANDDRRSFEIELAASGPRDVGLSYVTEAPAWKNSWRLLLDEGRLQGWATFENVTGYDWNGVDLVLSTGSPVAYQRNLLEPRRIGRPAAPDLIGERPEVEADEGFERMKRSFAALQSVGGASADAEMSQIAPAPMAEISGAAETAGEVVGLANVRYQMPRPVDLPAGRTANVIYIDLPVEPEIRALYQPARSGTVLLAARITADRPLAPGLVSVLDEGGFAGDAPFTGLAADETRLLPYAAAQGVTVTEDRQQTGNELDLAFAGGVLSLETTNTTRTLYEAALPDTIDIFDVEHARTGSDLVSANGEVERNADSLRVSVPATDGTARVEIVERELLRRTIAIDRNQVEEIFAQISRTSPTIDPEDRAVLEEAAGVLETIRQAEARRNDLSERYERLTREQERLRENVRSVEQSTLRQRYLDSLDRTETEIAEALSGIESATSEIEIAETSLTETIARLR